MREYVTGSVLLNVGLFLIWSVFLTLSLTPRLRRRWLCVAVLFLAVSLAAVAANFLPHRAVQLKAPLAILALMAGSFLAFSDPWTKKLYAALLAAYKNRRQKKSLAMKNELLEKQRRMQQERLQELDRQDGEIQAMCAAITAEAEELRRMLERGETEQARACAERVLADNAYRARLENCENPIADSFLATRADSLRAAGIRLELETRLPYHLGITDVELITMLGNLLDNAAEACEKLEPEKRRVSLRAAQGDGFFAVHMENSCLPQAQPAPRRIRGLQRGLGLTILEELARRYDGAVSAGPGGEGVYLTDITLQTGSKGALAT